MRIASLALTLTSAFALVPGTLGAGEPVRIVETLSVPLQALPGSNTTHDLRLSLYTFRGTRWQHAEILPAVQESARLLAQCGISVSSADLRVLDAPRAFHFYSTPRSRVLLREMEVARPALFFVEDTHNDPAFDAEAIGVSNAATRPELANTVWVAYEARFLAKVLAHELVHVLSDSGEHTYEARNLMRPDTAPGNTRLSAAQCRALRDRGEANGLLSRRGR